MDNDEALQLISEGKAAAFNQYRELHTDYIPDFQGQVVGVRKKILRVNFEYANLTNARIIGNLTGSNFSHTNIFGTDFSSAVFQQRAIWENARFDINTKFSSTFNAVTKGALFMASHEAKTIEIISKTAFISYAWANEKIVVAIEAWLRKRSINTKIDKRDFFAGSRIRDEIIRTMSNCNVILIFFSKESAKKPWPEFERELAADLEMNAKKNNVEAPLIIYVNVDNTPFPSIIEENRIAIMAKGKRFPLVCEEIYHSILRMPRKTSDIKLSDFDGYVF